MTTVLTAAFVAPMDGPLIRDGAVAFEDGRILSVDGIKTIRNQNPNSEIIDAGNTVILPGLVNAHAHLELSGCTAGDPPASFTDWIGSIPARIGPQPDFAAAARAGAQQSVRFGVTTVGDISQQCHLTRPALRDGPLHVISYGEVLGIGGSRWKVGELLERAMDKSAASPHLTIGVSPHAPYSLDSTNYRNVVDVARWADLPIATHIAELPYERDFLENKSGPLREFLDTIGLWRDDINTFAGPPLKLAQSTELLNAHAVLAHVNYCTDEELAMLAGGNASVVYCPRTHQYFGHPPHRWREMLAAGINVAVGTDSCASSPNLNLVDDLRLMHRIAPQVDPSVLWEMATFRAARALGVEWIAGTLTAGKRADFAVFPIRGDSPLTDILETDVAPSHVWIEGERVHGGAEVRRRPASG
jgi:aminodeoxyfutalosine deaminase